MTFFKLEEQNSTYKTITIMSNKIISDQKNSRSKKLTNLYSDNDTNTEDPEMEFIIMNEWRVFNGPFNITGHIKPS